MIHDREPLTPEERALAERLARMSPRAEPSPALDARILSAARAATAAPSAPARRRRRRWPAALGVAASLALAVGIAWQLRPVPQQASLSTPEAPASSAAPSPPADAPAKAIADAEMPAAPADARDASTRRPTAARQIATERRESAPPSPPQAPPPAPAGAAPEHAGAAMDADAALARKAARQGAETSRAKEEADAAARRTGERRREAIAADAPPSAQASPAALPPPPAAEPAFVPSPPPVETAIGRRRVQQTTPATSAANAPLPQRTPLERSAAAGSRTPTAAAAEQEAFHDQPLDDEPPATADSPEVHKAWLARIRELREDGEHEAARASLREFHRRYPKVPLPEDLRRLLDE